jgi:hypothetical protein
MKTFLLTCGFKYYPSSCSGDWIACYATQEEAEEAERKTCKGRKCEYDWCEIVDLKEWIYDLKPSQV